jgi:DNA polymerase-3 subunit gamma/tau
MVLVRIAYVADLPTPDEAIRMLEQNGGGASPAAMVGASSRGTPAGGGSPMGASPVRATAAPQSQTVPRAQAAPVRDGEPAAVRVTSYPQLVALAAQHRDLMTKAALESDMRLVRFEDGRLEVALEPNASRTLISDLSRKLEQWTGRRWAVVVSNEAGQPTIRSQNEAAQNQRERAAEADPRVQEVLARFPGAKIIEVRRLAPEPPESEIISEDPAEISDSDED